MDKQDQKSHVARIADDSIAANDVGFRRRCRAFLAGHLQDNLAYEDIIKNTFALIDTYKKHEDELIRERAHKTEAAIYAEVPFILKPDDITKLWSEAAEETNGSVRAAIQRKLHTIIDKRFDLITPETVIAIARAATKEGDWNSYNQTNSNLELVLKKEQQHGAIVSLSPIIECFRRASRHTNPAVRKNVLIGYRNLVPFADANHIDELAMLILWPSIFDKDPEVCSEGRTTAHIAIHENTSTAKAMAYYIRKLAPKAQKNPQTKMQYDKTMQACRKGMAALTESLFPG